MKPVVVLLVGILAAFSAMDLVASECPVGCPMEFDPVCGSDGETYPSACDLGIAACNNPSRNITLKLEGDCADGPPPPPPAPTTSLPVTTVPAPTTDKCRVSCTKEFVPVCGSNGKTYANYCGLLRDKCRQPTLKKLYSGVCKTKAKTKSWIPST